MCTCSPGECIIEDTYVYFIMGLVFKLLQLCWLTLKKIIIIAVVSSILGITVLYLCCIFEIAEIAGIFPARQYAVLGRRSYIEGCGKTKMTLLTLTLLLLYLGIRVHAGYHPSWLIKIAPANQASGVFYADSLAQQNGLVNVGQVSIAISLQWVTIFY